LNTYLISFTAIHLCTTCREELMSTYFKGRY
jgi:hypothetical protein